VKRWLLSGVLLLVATAAGADIVEWSDAEGVRHYTNVEAEVPPGYRATAQVIVSEQVWRARAADATEASMPLSPGAGTTEAGRMATVVRDWQPAAEAYVAGLERGLRLARGGDVTISGPLAVANSAGAVSPSDYWLPAPVYPLVTTSFDRGRSRHRTLRMLLQEQFALDQEGPYVFEDQFAPPPLGVGLSPLLPRGLPHGFPRNLRVITR
jgi:hypothetical protein